MPKVMVPNWQSSTQSLLSAIKMDIQYKMKMALIEDIVIDFDDFEKHKIKTVCTGDHHSVPSHAKTNILCLVSILIKVDGTQKK